MNTTPHHRTGSAAKGKQDCLGAGDPLPAERRSRAGGRAGDAVYTFYIDVIYIARATENLPCQIL